VLVGARPKELLHFIGSQKFRLTAHGLDNVGCLGGALVGADAQLWHLCVGRSRAGGICVEAIVTYAVVAVLLAASVD
jgi:hypothetical protein